MQTKMGPPVPYPIMSTWRWLEERQNDAMVGRLWGRLYADATTTAERAVDEWADRNGIPWASGGGP